jgi:hypothetical protein
MSAGEDSGSSSRKKKIVHVLFSQRVAMKKEGAVRQLSFKAPYSITIPARRKGLFLIIMK